MKNKLKDSLLEISFVLLLARFLYAGTSISDAVVLISLVISIVYTKYYLRKEADIQDEAATNELNELKRRVDALSMSAGLRSGQKK